MSDDMSDGNVINDLLDKLKVQEKQIARELEDNNGLRATIGKIMYRKNNPKIHDTHELKLKEKYLTSELEKLLK